MRITGLEEITKFIGKYPESKASMLHWKETVSALVWKTPVGVRQTFRTVDFVKGQAVFNVGGNNYRLIAVIRYQAGLVAIQAVMRHEEYEEDKWK